MAEIAKNKDQEHEVVVIEEDNDGSSQTKNTNASFLRELNLVMILSFLSSSAEGCLDPEEVKREMNHVKDRKKPKPAAPKRTRELNELRAVERQSGRFQPRVRDCRHCRKM